MIRSTDLLYISLMSSDCLNCLHVYNLVYFEQNTPSFSDNKMNFIIFIKVTETQVFVVYQISRRSIGFSILFYGWIGRVRATHDSHFKVEFWAVLSVRSLLLHCNIIHHLTIPPSLLIFFVWNAVTVLGGWLYFIMIYHWVMIIVYFVM